MSIFQGPYYRLGGRKLPAGRSHSYPALLYSRFSLSCSSATILHCAPSPGIQVCTPARFSPSFLHNTISIVIDNTILLYARGLLKCLLRVLNVHSMCIRGLFFSVLAHRSGNAASATLKGNHADRPQPDGLSASHFRFISYMPSWIDLLL